MRTLLFTTFLILLSLVVSAQSTLPIIRATSNNASIRFDNTLNVNGWNINPKLNPDIYQTSAHNVTFITDQDSIHFTVKRNRVYNFIILLNNRDTAYTQIKYVAGNKLKTIPQVTYLDILRKAKKYNYSDDRAILRITYPASDNPALKAIRQKFNLDSVAGTGNEVSKLLSLLHWVHNTFPHDGGKDVPDYKSRIELMTNTISQHLTLDCGTLASVLTDCYLAMGWKAHRIICLPKDSTDYDCHSIVTVYSNTLNKWLWIDPTHEAYVMNEQGVLLSIAEVRERLINGKPLILNPDANWNHKISNTRENYLFGYMAKNLYALQCIGDREGESITNVLLPLDYKGIIPRTASTKPKCTNNPNIFWAKPE
jgi:hypothetical protein